MPPKSCTIPTKVPLTVLAIGSSMKRHRSAGGEFRSDANNLALLKRGDQIPPVKDAAGGPPSGVTLIDQHLAPMLHSVGNLIPLASPGEKADAFSFRDSS